MGELLAGSHTETNTLRRQTKEQLYSDFPGLHTSQKLGEILNSADTGRIEVWEDYTYHAFMHFEGPRDYIVDIMRRTLSNSRSRPAGPVYMVTDINEIN